MYSKMAQLNYATTSVSLFILPAAMWYNKMNKMLNYITVLGNILFRQSLVKALWTIHTFAVHSVSKKCPIWVVFVMSLSVGKPESQTSSISPKSKPTSVTPRPPAPPGTKPHLGPHSLGLLSPRTSSSHSPGRHMNKYTLLIVIWRWEIRPSE